MSKRIVSEIWIYPVKSLGGIRLSSSKVLPKGLEHDRRWMLIDEEK
ncbi:MAG: MOSC N-terminal beta barrel domain-containing protein [Bacteroidota bacterium]